eukprot:761318-Hanusia_phi.AAC.4
MEPSQISCPQPAHRPWPADTRSASLPASSGKSRSSSVSVREDRSCSIAASRLHCWSEADGRREGRGSEDEDGRGDEADDKGRRRTDRSFSPPATIVAHDHLSSEVGELSWQLSDVFAELCDRFDISWGLLQDV